MSKGFAARHDLLRWAIAIGRRRETLKATTRAQYRARQTEQPIVTPEGAALRRQTLRWRHQFFVFLTDLEVQPPTTEPPSNCWTPLLSSARGRRVFDDETASQFHG